MLNRFIGWVKELTTKSGQRGGPILQIEQYDIPASQLGNKVKFEETYERYLRFISTHGRQPRTSNPYEKTLYKFMHRWKKKCREYDNGEHHHPDYIEKMRPLVQKFISKTV